MVDHLKRAMELLEQLPGRCRVVKTFTQGDSTIVVAVDHSPDSGRVELTKSELLAALDDARRDVTDVFDAVIMEGVDLSVNH